MNFFFIITLLIIFSVSNNTSAQTFWKKYEMTNGTAGSAVETYDGGYIIISTMYLSQGGGPWALYIIRTDSLGDTLSTRILNDTPNSSGSVAGTIQKTNDSCFIAACVEITFGGPSTHTGIYLIKFDRTGNILWNKVIIPNSGLIKYSYPFIKQTFDNGFIIHTKRSDDQGSVLLKTDSIGNVEWIKTATVNIFPDIIQLVGDVVQTQDSGYIMLSIVTNINNANKKTVISKVNNYGNLQWSKITGDSVYSSAQNIYETYNGDIIFSKGGKLIRISSNGTFISSREYRSSQGSVDIYSFSKCTHGNIIYCGLRSDLPDNPCVLFLSDSTGNIKWVRNFSGLIGQVKQISDGSFIIDGFEPGTRDYIHLFKTDTIGFNNCIIDTTLIMFIDTSHSTLFNYSLTIDSTTSTLYIPNLPNDHGGNVIDNCIPVGIVEGKNSNNSIFFPNPSTGKFLIKNIEHNSEIKIFNLLGKIIFQSSYINSDSEINLTNQPKGIYFCNIISIDNFSEKIKIILQ